MAPKRLALLFSALSLTLLSAQARLRDGRLHANFPPPPAIPRVSIDSGVAVVDRNGNTLPPYNTTYEFDQLIDHNNPGLGTFKQRYWHTWEFYEAGGPIILMTPGEANADGFDGYLTNRSINGQVAQQQNGATIVLEHRFFGLSNPFPDLSVQSLQVHTLRQAIDDLIFFANNVKLPMPNGDQVSPDKAPWVLMGGSYAGALTSWTMNAKPGFFAAGYASSGVVEAITDYWGYFEPIRQFMPKNCSSDVGAVVAHFDKTFASGNATAINALKASFGMETVTHLDDAAGALRNNLWDWQSLQPTSGPGAQFFKFCDALEVKDGVSAPAKGWGLDHALTAWGSYFKNTYLPLICGGSSAQDCLGTYDLTQSFWSDTSIDNAWRSWYWIVCHEVGYLQDGAPKFWPSIVSRQIQNNYDDRQCKQMFTGEFDKVAPFSKVSTTNRLYNGWNTRINNIFFANGQRDPWREATVSADLHFFPNTPSHPVVVGDGFHCSDLSTRTATVDPTIANIQTQALASMKTWLANWKPGKATPRTRITPSNGPRGSRSTTRTKPVNAWLKGVGFF